VILIFGLILEKYNVYNNVFSSSFIEENVGTHAFRAARKEDMKF
jgi:hypothetical protein